MILGGIAAGSCRILGERRSRVVAIFFRSMESVPSFFLALCFRSKMRWLDYHSIFYLPASSRRATGNENSFVHSERKD
jgi:hypothetical protein